MTYPTAFSTRPFSLPLADAARGDGKAEVVGEVLVARVEHRRFADQTPQHRGLKIVDHDRAGTPPKEAKALAWQARKCSIVCDGELDVQHPAVAQHHHEEAQPPAGVTHADRAELAPVHLGAFAGGEGERQEGLPARRADLVDIVLDDGDPAGVAALAQPQEDLLRRCRDGSPASGRSGP